MSIEKVIVDKITVIVDKITINEAKNVPDICIEILDIYMIKTTS